MSQYASSYGGSPAYSSCSSSYACGYSGSAAYSSLAAQGMPQESYASQKSMDASFFPPLEHMQETVFLEPNRVELPVITSDLDIMPLVRETFQALTDKELPSNIRITVATPEKCKHIHTSTGGRWSESIQGFSINKAGKGTSEIVVKQAPLDSMMLTVGHEIGHVLTLPLATTQDEEAKAFAFSIAWVKAIRQNNIGNIAGNFREAPAQNGVHDVGYAFVQQLLERGKTAVRVYTELAKRIIAINTTPELILIS